MPASTLTSSMRNFDQKMRLIHQMPEPPMSGQGLKKGNPNPLYFINSKATGMRVMIGRSFRCVVFLTFCRSWLRLEMEGRTELEMGLGALFACRPVVATSHKCSSTDWVIEEQARFNRLYHQHCWHPSSTWSRPLQQGPDSQPFQRCGLDLIPRHHYLR